MTTKAISKHNQKLESLKNEARELGYDPDEYLNRMLPVIKKLKEERITKRSKKSRKTVNNQDDNCLVLDTKVVCV